MRKQLDFITFAEDEILKHNKEFFKWIDTKEEEAKFTETQLKGKIGFVPASYASDEMEEVISEIRDLKDDVYESIKTKDIEFIKEQLMLLNNVIENEGFKKIDFELLLKEELSEEIEEEESPLTEVADGAGEEELEVLAVEVENKKIENKKEKEMKNIITILTAGTTQESTVENKKVTIKVAETKIQEKGVEMNMKQQYNQFIYGNKSVSEDTKVTKGINELAAAVTKAKEEALAEITNMETVRLFTNFHVGSMEKFANLFKNILFVAASPADSKYTAIQDMSLRCDVNTGFTAYSDFKGAQENALFQQGTKDVALNSRAQEFLVNSKKELKGKKEIVITEKVGDNVLENILQNEAHLISTTEKNYDLIQNESSNEFVLKLKGLCNKYGVNLANTATLINKDGKETVKMSIKGAEKFNDLIVPLLRPFQLGNVTMLTDGDNVFSGSVQFVSSEKEHVYLNTMDCYLKFVEEYIKNMKNELQQDASMLIYDSKDKDEDKASIFVRVGSLDKLFIWNNGQEAQRIDFNSLMSYVELNKGKRTSTEFLNLLISQDMVEIATAKKTLTLVGNHHEVNELIFAKMVISTIDIDTNKDELVLPANNHCIAAGAGNNVNYRICNLLGKYLLSDEDKYMANLFAGIGGMTKASRYNNPDSNFVYQTNICKLFNWKKDRIPSKFKAVAMLMINTTDLSLEGVPFNKALKGFAYNNSLDCYAAGEEMRNNFKTISDLDSEFEYLVADISDDFKEDAYHWLKTGEIVGSLRGIPEEMRKRILSKIRRLPENYVAKASFCHLKGSFVFLKDQFSFELSEGTKLTEKHLQFIKESYVLSNNILHKQEFANNHVVSKSIEKQIEEGKKEFEVYLPKKIAEPSVEEIESVWLIVNGQKYLCKMVFTICNVHDLKNNLVSQGSSCIKEGMYSNIQDFNSTRWLSKNPLGVTYGNSFMKAYYSANREFKKCKLIEVKETEGLTVYVNPNITGYNTIVEKLKAKGMSVETNKGLCDIILGGKVFEGDKIYIMDKEFNVKKTLISECPDGKLSEDEFLINSRRTKKYFSKDEIFSILQEKEILSYEELNKVITVPGKNRISFLDLLGKMSSKSLVRLSEASKLLKGYNLGDTRIKGLLEVLSDIRAFEVLPGKYMMYLPSMKKISIYFPKELTVCVKVAQAIQSLSAHEEIVNVILEGKVTGVHSYFNFLKNNFKHYSNMFDLISEKAIVTIFDKENNIPAEDGMVYVLKSENKIGIYQMTESIGALVKFHEEKIFTKNAKYLLSEANTGFYATYLTMHCGQNEVRVNPKSQGFKQFLEFEGQYVLVGRFPITGERGLGLKLVLDENVPLNCILTHPAIGEQFMADTDGDMAYIVFLADSYCRKFTVQEVNEEVYFNFYAHKPAFSKAYKKVINMITGKEEKIFKEMDLTPSAVVKRNQMFREQAMFNPNFVGRITTACMKFANRVYEEFVLQADFKNDEEMIKAKAVYEFYIRVVQKQLSQIPIAAKNTDLQGLKDFKELWDNFAAGNLPVSELDQFINVTGWDELTGILTGRLVTEIDQDGKVETYIKDHFAEEKKAQRRAELAARKAAKEETKEEEKVEVNLEAINKLKSQLKF